MHSSCQKSHHGFFFMLQTMTENWPPVLLNVWTMILLTDPLCLSSVVEQFHIFSPIVVVHVKTLMTTSQKIFRGIFVIIFAYNGHTLLWSCYNSSIHNLCICMAISYSYSDHSSSLISTPSCKYSYMHILRDVARSATLHYLYLNVKQSCTEM